MRFLQRILRLVSGASDEPPIEPRHVRRERARRIHDESGAPLWPDEERHLNPSGTREVQDITPGTSIGAPSSRRTIRDD